MPAAANGHLDVVKFLAGERGADVEATKPDGGTVLMGAALHGELAVVKYLAGERGATIDAKNVWGGTALIAAAQATNKKQNKKK